MGWYGDSVVESYICSLKKGKGGLWGGWVGREEVWCCGWIDTWVDEEMRR